MRISFSLGGGLGGGKTTFFGVLLGEEGCDAEDHRVVRRKAAPDRKGQKQVAISSLQVHLGGGIQGQWEKKESSGRIGVVTRKEVLGGNRSKAVRRGGDSPTGVGAEGGSIGQSLVRGRRKIYLALCPL